VTPTRRYLDLLKSALLNDIYIENEVRLLYLFAMHATRGKVDFEVVRQIGKHIPDALAKAQKARLEGRPWWYWESVSGGNQKIINLRNGCEFSHTMIGRKRLENIEHCLDVIRAEGIPGDLIETGVWLGGATIFMRGYLAAYDLPERSVWVADSFEGLPKPSLAQDEGWDFSAAEMPILAVSLDEVKENFRRYDLLDDRVRFLKGWFKDTLPTAPIGKLALARMDGDLYESTMDALNALYDRVVPGGFLLIDDYGDFEPCRRAVDEFRQHRGITVPLQRVDWSGMFWRKP
jgi:O-methyltransferase